MVKYKFYFKPINEDQKLTTTSLGIQAPNGYSMSWTVEPSDSPCYGAFTGTLKYPSSNTNPNIQWYVGGSPMTGGNNATVTDPYYPTCLGPTDQCDPNCIFSESIDVTFDVQWISNNIFTYKLSTPYGMGYPSSGSTTDLTGLSTNSYVSYSAPSGSSMGINITINNCPNLPFAAKLADETDGKHLTFKVDNGYQNKSSYTSNYVNSDSVNVYVSYYAGPNNINGSYNTSGNYFVSCSTPISTPVRKSGTIGINTITYIQ